MIKTFLEACQRLFSLKTVVVLFLFSVIEIFSEACQRLFSLKNSDGGVITPGG